jgi:hypothetical protein
MLCLGILTRIEGDAFNLPPSLDRLTLARAKAERAVEQFQKALDLAKSDMELAGNAVTYLLSPDNPGVTLELICDYCGLDAETVLRKLLEPLDYDLGDFLQQKPGAKCPLCEVSNTRPAVDPEKQVLCLEKLGELQELLRCQTT